MRIPLRSKSWENSRSLSRTTLWASNSAIKYRVDLLRLKAHTFVVVMSVVIVSTVVTPSATRAGDAYKQRDSLRRSISNKPLDSARNWPTILRQWASTELLCSERKQYRMCVMRMNIPLNRNRHFVAKALEKIDEHTHLQIDDDRERNRSTIKPEEVVAFVISTRNPVGWNCGKLKSPNWTAWLASASLFLPQK